MPKVDESKLEQSTEFSKTGMPQRVLFVIHSMRGGGAERQMSYLANEFAALTTTSLLTYDLDRNDFYPLDSRIDRIGLEVTGNQGGMCRGIIANLRRIRAIRRAIIDWKPDVVVSFCDSNNTLTLLACPKTIPVVISERSDPRQQKLNRGWETLRRFSYPKCRFCVVQTSTIGDYLSNNKLVDSKKIRVIQSAIHVPQRVAVHERLRSQSQNKTLCYVGRLSWEKRIDRLLHAWAKLTNHHAQWHINIVGDGPERASLQSLATALGVSSSIRWSLWSDDVWQHLLAADAYCLVSQYEGFPQSMLEAMAAELPVAVLDCSPAIRETIRDGIEGLVIPDESKIAEVLDRLLSNDSLRESLGRSAKIRSLEYDWSKVVPRWLKIICQATN